MVRVAFRSLGWVFIVSTIVGCGTVYTNADDGYQPSILGPATPQACTKSLAKANQWLTAFESKSHSGAIDTKAMRAILGSAKSAQQNKDYMTCEVKAQQVLSYIQRDQNYEAWNKSLQP